MKPTRLLVLLVVLFCAFAAPAYSQVAPSPVIDSTLSDTTVVDSSKAPLIQNDTILFVPPVFHGELPVTDSTNLEERLRQRPTTALLKSLAIPGWGQIGNGRVTKAVIFAGLQGWCIGAAIHYGKSASNFKDSYEAATVVSTRNQYYSMFKDRRQERNKYLFFLGLTTLVSVFDAYVDAHLTGSPANRTETIGLELAPTADGMQAAISFRF
ncbi:MAG: hypothetical protein IPH75_08285 [bacterium]|nr:hypothetical protein [bacterium]